MQHKTTTGTKLIAVLLLIPITCVAWLSYGWGQADRYAYTAAQQVKQWLDGAAIVEEDLYQTMDSARLSVQLAPGNPAYLDQLARLIVIKSLFEGERSEAKAAILLLERSRHIRPEWPENWATYIDTKFYLREPDKEMSRAIVRATEHGPWEARVLQAVAQAGVQYFKDLTPEAQESVIDSLQRGLRSPVGGVSDRMVELIKNGASGWNIDFTQKMLAHLSNEPWDNRFSINYTRLALLWWRLADMNQIQRLSVRISSSVESSHSNTLIKELRQSGKLPVICLFLPRTDRNSTICKNFH